jgi:hypothetical protein
MAAYNYLTAFQSSQNRITAAIPGITWVERGPNNVGGRTRAMMVDPNDATHKSVFAAGVGGGLWKTTDITAASPVWTPVNDLFANIAITAITYDPTNPNIMYFGTGEGWFNLDAIRGDGIWKSTNGGATFTQLASTPGSVTTNFNYVNKIAVHPVTGDVYAATMAGLFRSQNGGTSWTKVLGAGTGASIDPMADVAIAADNSIVAATGRVFSGSDGVYRSTTGAAASWTKLNTGANGFPTTGFERITLALAPSNANVMYAITQSTSTDGIFHIYTTSNKGTSWTTATNPTDADPGIGTEYTRGQAWYDLAAAVDPNNAATLIVGGVDLFKSTNSGTAWTQLTHWYGGFGFQNVHADQHAIVFQPGSSSNVYFGNDGGAWSSSDGGTTIAAKSINYNVTQFYACAMNPAAGSDQFMAGAQDNGTQQFSTPGVNATVEVTGGDGAFCHIDQSNALYQYSSYVYNNLYRSTDGGVSFNSIRADNNGSFINPSDFDDANGNFYAAYTAGKYTRLLTAHTSTTFNNIAVAAFAGATVTAVTVSPTVAHRVYFGLNNGMVVKVNAANATPVATVMNSGTGMLGSVSISCIAVMNNDENHLLVTISNYGWNSVWETKNGGTTWTSVEGNLPDMPIRNILFNPADSSQALVATELGVWSTSQLLGGSTVWAPSNTGLANVRADYFQIRNSDKMVIVATHGRGLYSSDIFAPASVNFAANKRVAYTTNSINFSDGSTKATSWNYTFGDGGTANTANPTHIYNTSGLFNCVLQINSGALTSTKNSYITVLPNRGTPYNPAAGGSFDLNPNDFAGEPVGNTLWQKGNSAVAGKNGTNSGSSAWCTNLVGNYTDDAYAVLYTPNYNFSAAGTYTLRFYRKNNFEIGYDGFNIEYSLNKGGTWSVLGTAGAGWYDFANAAGGTAFPMGVPFFNATVAAYTLTSRNVSTLAGNTNVAFRFVFRSDNSTVSAGMAIDDFEIIGPSNAALPVSLASFTAKKDGVNNLLNWVTLSEKNNDGFNVERSTNGTDFETLGFVRGAGTTNTPREYSFIDYKVSGLISYYRLQQFDFDGVSAYSKTIALRNENNASDFVSIYPNPVTNVINFVFTKNQAENFTVKCYSSNGDLLLEKEISVAGLIYSLNLDEIRMPAGVYFIKLSNELHQFNSRILKQ